MSAEGFTYIGQKRNNVLAQSVRGHHSSALPHLRGRRNVIRATLDGLHTKTLAQQRSVTTGMTHGGEGQSSPHWTRCGAELTETHRAGQSEPRCKVGGSPQQDPGQPPPSVTNKY